MKNLSLTKLMVCALLAFDLAQAQTPAVSQPVAKSPAMLSATVFKVTSNVSVDGVMDESAWSEAIPIGEIVQREPKPGAPATEQTVVKLLHDNQNLYVGVVCYDLEPEKIIGTQMARDADLSVDDRVEILIDTFHDRRNAFYFSTNPLGALVDALIIENGETNRDWNAIWDVRTQE